MSDTLERLRVILDSWGEPSDWPISPFSLGEARALLDIAEAAQALAPLFHYSSTYQRDPDFHAKAYVLLQTLAALDAAGGAER